MQCNQCHAVRQQWEHVITVVPVIISVYRVTEEEVAEFLEPLMSHLGAVLAGGGPDTQHSAISAVASAAEAAGDAFAPYVPGVLPHLRRYMDLTQVRSLGCSSPKGIEGFGR